MKPFDARVRDALSWVAGETRRLEDRLGQLSAAERRAFEEEPIILDLVDGAKCAKTLDGRLRQAFAALGDDLGRFELRLERAMRVGML